MENKRPICLFDSGIGGFTVLKQLLKLHPNESYIYLANLADMPFGEKTEDEIIELANKNISWLSSFNPKAILMACNTSSSLLTNKKNEVIESDFPIHGIIKPVTKEVAKSNYKKVTVWATSRTINSNAYKDEINELNPNIEVEQVSCPKLVPIIENLSSTREEKENAINEYLQKTSKDSEGLIWGCTHYPLLSDIFSNISTIKTIDPAYAQISTLSLPTTNNDSSNLDVQIYTTAQPEKVKQFSLVYLGQNFEVKNISLPKEAITK